MTHSGKLAALLDANVLYPAPLRDYLLRLAALDLYKPLWTSMIHDEWIRNLLVNRPDLGQEALDRTKAAMDAAFPDACVCGYENLIAGIVLPDIDDRHVLAAAIKGNADVIVTSNLKDFPLKKLQKYNIKAQRPDEFVLHLIHLDKKRCVRALNNLVQSFRNPPKTRIEVLETLSACGLFNSSALLQGL